MDYETAVTSRQALEDIKNGINVESNVLLLEQALGPIIDKDIQRGEKRLRGVDTFYMEYNPLIEVIKAINAMSNAKKFYAVAADEERRRENERQDLLHVLEFLDEPEDILQERAKEIALASRDRRIVKNFQELIKPFYAFLIKNPKLLEDMRKVHSEMVKIDNNMKIRQYTPKERRDFDPLFNKPREGVEME